MQQSNERDTLDSDRWGRTALGPRIEFRDRRQVLQVASLQFIRLDCGESRCDPRMS